MPEVGNHRQPHALGCTQAPRETPSATAAGTEFDMPHIATPLVHPDLSQFARALGRAWKQRHDSATPPPGHQELLNLIARAAGHRNLQALQAAARPPAPPRLARATAAPLPLSDNARKALLQFDDQGRLVRWPVKYSVQTLVMWVMWSYFEPRRSYTEAEVNAVLKGAQTYGDHVTLRRELINHRLMSRRSDCSDYRKLPARPDDEARALLQAWRALLRRQGRPADSAGPR